jgi:hypothetical protein
MWLFRMKLYSKARTHVTQYTRALTDDEYEIPGFREAAEQEVEDKLRALEGVTLETPIERVDWLYMPDPTF